MSSGLVEGGLLAVCEQGPVGDVGESAFEKPEGFSFGRSAGEAALDEGLGVGVHPHLGDGDAVQRGVGVGSLPG